MTNNTNNYVDLDKTLLSTINSYSSDDEDFWSFRGRIVREHTHGYFQYPAMMVPRMQGQLIQAVSAVVPNIRSVFDPFVGSGTVMTESMLQGLDFYGCDINPLAVLLCRAKLGPFHVEVLSGKVDRVLKLIREDKRDSIEAKFESLNKWFRQDIAVGLSRIVRAVRIDSDLWARRFFWIALAETVRLTSNSRTSTFKLHIRPKDEIERRNTSPEKLFDEIVRKNFSNLCSQKQVLEEQDLLKDEVYNRVSEVWLADATKHEALNTAPRLYDLLVTSPPYGDNVSTVPYGQYSYLPLQWVDHEDIDEAMDRNWLISTHEIDRRSLGGTRARALEETVELLDVAPSFRKTIEQLQTEPRDRAMRVAAFCRDLNRCVDPILTVMKPNAYMFWTVGNRRVAGRPVPIDKILLELLEARGATHITSVQRAITPQKRMALKNAIAPTMRAETVLVVRKGSA